MPKNRKDTVKTNIKTKGKPWLKCRNCGKKWYPDARKWRNKNPVEEKYLRCPHCNVKNRVPRVVVKFLIDRANKDTEYGFD